ncbi:MAG TPA: metal-dependent hydrolase [Patescibacteria group bacterium]|nr:metal-dependent hydrolase [Patescibacteria group bacterium]
MTGRTHDLAAFTTLTYIIATQPLIQMSLATAFTAIAANMIGGIAPDIDQPTGKIWHKIPAGGIFGKIAHQFTGSHRSISHSLLGMAIFGFLSSKLLNYIHTFLLVDIKIVWIAFMLGVISHLVMDTFTKEGVPWLFPIPIRFGIPPIKAWRVTTGSIVERGFVFPLLLVTNGYLIYHHYEKFLDFIRHYITK